MSLLFKSSFKTKLLSTKGVSWMIFLLLLGAHLLFLSIQLVDVNLLIISSLIFFLFVGYYAIHKRDDVKLAYRLSHHSIHKTIYFTLNDLVILISCTVGALATFFAINISEFPAVLVLSGLTLMVSIIKRFIKSQLFIYSDFAFYAGAFVGGSTQDIAGAMDYGFIGFAGLLTGILYVLSKNVLVGVGGRLGSFAFISVYIVYAISYFW